MENFRFSEWPVYKLAKEITSVVFGLTKSFPQGFRYDLGSQLNRSVISIVLNIAEGSGKGSDRDFTRFLNIATGSINETFAGLDLARDNGLISKGDFNAAALQLLDIAKQLTGFRKKLQSKVHSS